MKQQTLTKGEMQVMNVLWELQKGACVNDILVHYPEPKPAYTTIATFLKILTQKGFGRANCSSIHPLSPKRNIVVR